jgi:hypothetical protein
MPDNSLEYLRLKLNVSHSLALTVVEVLFFIAMSKPFRKPASRGELRSAT